MGDGASDDGILRPSIMLPKGRRIRPMARLDTLLAQYLEKNQPQQPSRARGGATLKVFRAFENLGPPIAERAEPVRYRAGVLTLAVGDSAWLTELSFLRQGILERVRRELDRIGGKKIRLKEVRLVHGGSRKAKRPKPKPKAPALSEREEQTIQGWVSEIDDPELREAIVRAARRGVASGTGRDR